LALRELARRDARAVGIDWTKSGGFYAIGSSVEADNFLDGVPRAASELRLKVGSDGGFYEVGGRLAREERLEFDFVIMATHGGPGQDGTLQAALDLAGIAYSGPTVAGAALGMDKWAFGAAVANVGLPTLPRVLLTESSTSLPFDGPYILKPRFGGSSIGIDVVGDMATALTRLKTNGHLARGCVAEPFRHDLYDLQIALLTYPELTLSAIERPLRRDEAAEILDYRDKYVGGEGMVSAPREAASQTERGAVPRDSRHRARGGPRGRRERGGSYRLPRERHRVVRQRDQYDSGSSSKHLFVDPPLSFAAILSRLGDEARTVPAHHYSSAGADG
jgi:D-alanine-D-alanine ligase